MLVEKLEKTIPEVVQKLSKLNIGEDLAGALSWCWVSFKNDQNESGLVEKATLALAALKEAREKNPKSVSKKLIDELEKALA